MEIKYSFEGKMMSHIHWHFQININYQKFRFKSLKKEQCCGQVRLGTERRDGSRM